METRSIKEDTTSTGVEFSMRILPPCVNHPHEKRKAKKQTKTKQNRAETDIQPLLDKYLDGPQLCSLPRRRTFGSSCNLP